MLFCPGRWQLQGKAAREKQDWKVEIGPQVPKLPFWNVSDAPKQTKGVLCPPALPTPVCCCPWHSSASLGEYFPRLFHPTSPSSARAGSWGCSDRSPWVVWWFCCFMELQHQLEIPLQHSLVSWCCLRRAKQLEGRGGVSPNLPWYSRRTPKLPGNKGHEFHDGRAGIVALGHSAFPLPISPAQTCPAPVSSHTNTRVGKYLRIMPTGIKQERDHEMRSLKSHFSSHQAVTPCA